MKKLKFVFFTFVLLFLMFNRNGQAQIQGLDLVSYTDTDSMKITIENNLNKEIELNIDLHAIFIENDSSQLLIAQDHIQNAIKTIFEYEAKLGPIIHQDDVFITLIPIIHQDDVFISSIHPNNIFSPIIHQDDVFRFLALLKNNVDLLNSIRTILNEEGGLELILELFNNEKELIKEESFTLAKKGSRIFQISTKGFKYDVIKVELRTENNNKKMHDILFAK